MASKFFRDQRRAQYEAQQQAQASKAYPGIPLAQGVEDFIDASLAEAGAEPMRGFSVITLEQTIKGDTITGFRARIEKDGRTAKIIYPPKEQTP